MMDPASDALQRRCRENLAAIRGRVAEACRRAGRPDGSVTLIGVTKYVGVETTRLLLEAGCRDLAESRPQQLWEKAAAIGDVELHPVWHLIGNLQRNKVRRTLPVVSLVHTLDSPRLLVAIEAEAAALGRPCEVLIEVNLTTDPGRSGVSEAEVPDLVAAAAAAVAAERSPLRKEARKAPGRWMIAKLQWRDSLIGTKTKSFANRSTRLVHRCTAL